MGLSATLRVLRCSYFLFALPRFLQSANDKLLSWIHSPVLIRLRRLCVSQNHPGLSTAFYGYCREDRQLSQPVLACLSASPQFLQCGNTAAEPRCAKE